MMTIEVNSSILAIRSSRVVNQTDDSYDNSVAGLAGLPRFQEPATSLEQGTIMMNNPVGDLDCAPIGLRYGRPLVCTTSLPN
jgi:hypothetical protein